MNKWLVKLQILLVLSIPTFACASHDYVWNAIAIDAQTKSPIEGVEIEILVIDKNDNDKKITSLCKTGTSGKCTLKASVDGGLFSGSSITYNFSIKKEGYSPTFIRYAKALSAKEEETTFRIASLTGPTNNKAWGLGEGPTINALTELQPRTIFDLFEKGISAPSKERGKFETEEEFKARSAATGKTLIVAPLSLADSQTACRSSYDHKSQSYSIAGCLIFNEGIAAIKTTEGESFKLSNAYDSRQIKRVLRNKYSFRNLSGASWTVRYTLSPKDSEALESDLWVAVVTEGTSLSSECSTCKLRDLVDSADKLSESLSALTGKSRSSGTSNGWKDDAFRTGAVEEFWERVVTVKASKRYYVYRMSDQKVLFETD